MAGLVAWAAACGPLSAAPSRVEPPSATPPPPAPAPPAPPAPAETPAEHAARLRARVPGLLAQGKLDRALRVLAFADTVWPASEPESWAPRVDALAEIGRYAEARKLAAEIDADPRSTPEAKAHAAAARAKVTAEDETRADGDRTKAPVRAQALLGAGLSAKKLGRLPEAQRLFDRAAVELTRASSEQLQLDTRLGFDGTTLGVAWPGDGHLLAVGALHGVFLFDTSTWRADHIFEPDAEMSYDSLAASADGRLLAGVSSTEIRVWNATSGMAPTVLRPGAASAAFSPDGRDLVAADADRVRRFSSAKDRYPDAATASSWPVHLGKAPSIAYGPDGGSITSISAERLVVLDSATGKVRLQRPLKDCSTHASSPRWLACLGADGRVAVLDPKTGNVRRTFATASPDSGPEVQGWDSDAAALGFSRDGSMLVTAPGGLSRNKRIGVWDPASGKLVRWIDHVDPAEWFVMSVTLSPDAKTVAIGTQSSGVQLFDVGSGKWLRALGREATWPGAVAWSRDGTKLTFASDDGARLWDIAAGRLAGSLTPADALAFHPDAKAGVVQSPDGKITARSEPPLVVLEDTVRNVGAQLPHPRGVSWMTFSPDGDLLVSVADAVRVWKARAGTLDWYAVRPRVDEARGPHRSAGDLLRGRQAPLRLGRRRRSPVGRRRLAAPPDPRGLPRREPRARAQREGGRLEQRARGGGARPPGRPRAVRAASRPRRPSRLRHLAGFRGRGFELLGDDPRDFVQCRVGAAIFPSDLCLERYEAPGFAARLLAGDEGPPEP